MPLSKEEQKEHAEIIKLFDEDPEALLKQPENLDKIVSHYRKLREQHLSVESEKIEKKRKKIEEDSKENANKTFDDL